MANRWGNNGNSDSTPATDKYLVIDLGEGGNAFENAQVVLLNETTAIPKHCCPQRARLLTSFASSSLLRIIVFNLCQFN